IKFIKQGCDERLRPRFGCCLLTLAGQLSNHAFLSLLVGSILSHSIRRKSKPNSQGDFANPPMEVLVISAPAYVLWIMRRFGACGRRNSLARVSRFSERTARLLLSQCGGPVDDDCDGTGRRVAGLGID